MMSIEFYSAELVPTIRDDLMEMAQEPPTQLTKKQMVEQLYEQLEAVLALHSYEEVAARLGKKGLEISSGSLKQYFGNARRERQGKSKRNKRKSKTVKPATPVESVGLESVASKPDSTIPQPLQSYGGDDESIFAYGK